MITPKIEEGKEEGVNGEICLRVEGKRSNIFISSAKHLVFLSIPNFSPISRFNMFCSLQLVFSYTWIWLKKSHESMNEQWMGIGIGESTQWNRKQSWSCYRFCLQRRYHSRPRPSFRMCRKVFSIRRGVSSPWPTLQGHPTNTPPTLLSISASSTVCHQA